MAKNVLLVADVANELDCTTQWVTELLRTNRLKGEKFGRQWIITRRDLNKYMASQKEAENK